jgi:hypothetical protein
MKKLILILTLAASTSFATNSSKSYLCYSGCTFDGYRQAETNCQNAAQAFNDGSNDAVQMHAICYRDNLNICGESGPLCTFPKIVLERTVWIQQ